MSTEFRITVIILKENGKFTKMGFPANGLYAKRAKRPMSDSSEDKMRKAMPS
jgi:hypothetical protein